MEETNFHPAPKWLNKDYLESVLQNHRKDKSLEILELDIKPATAKGENYASIMTRITVNFITGQCRDIQQASYIVKTSYEDDPFVSNIMSGYDIYNTEMSMYEKILPQLSNLLREAGDEDKLFADTIHVDYEHTAIIFEDLAVWNFGLADRLVGMDVVHTKLALKKLAKMHAAAAVLNERSPGILKKYTRGIINRHTQGFSTFFENMFEVCAAYADSCETLGEYYKEKLLKLKPKVMEYCNRVFDERPTFFNTLNHGDYWINNIMLRYHESDECDLRVIQDIRLIDFQFSCWGSPAVDLHYFLNTSLDPELSLHHQDELIQHYHAILGEYLGRLKYAGHIPSLHEFCLQMEAGRFYALSSTLVQQPMMINDKTEDADFHALVSDDERGRNFRKLVYTNKFVQANVRALLPIFDRRGLLDVND